MECHIYDAGDNRWELQICEFNGVEKNPCVGRFTDDQLIDILKAQEKHLKIVRNCSSQAKDDELSMLLTQNNLFAESY